MFKKKRRRPRESNDAFKAAQVGANDPRDEEDDSQGLVLASSGAKGKEKSKQTVSQQFSTKVNEKQLKGFLEEPKRHKAPKLQPGTRDKDRQENNVYSKQAIAQLRAESTRPKDQRPQQQASLSEEEDAEEWEMEQLKRSGNISQAQAQASAANTSWMRYEKAERGAESFVESIKSQLQQKQESMANNKRRTTQLSAEIDALEKQLGSSQNVLASTSKTHDLLQHNKVFIQGLRSFIQVKLDMVQDALDAMLEQCIKNQKDARGSLAQITAQIVQAAKMEGLGIESGAAAAAAAARATSQATDEFGRIVEKPALPIQELTKSVATEQAKDKMSQITRANQMIYKDVDEPYNCLDACLDRFNQWRKQMPQQYKDVYADLAVPMLISPYVKSELLEWLFEKKEGVFAWHRTLERLAFPKQVVADVYLKNVLPILKQLVLSGGWQPLYSDAKHLLVVVQTARSLPIQSDLFAQLQDAISNQFVQAENDLILAGCLWKCRHPDAELFCNHQVSLGLALLENADLWTIHDQNPFKNRFLSFLQDAPLNVKKSAMDKVAEK